MPVGFDKTLSELTEGMTESLPTSEKENKEKRERIKAVAYFLCKNGFTHAHIEPNELLILDKKEGSRYAAKMTRPISKNELFDRELIENFTKDADNLEIPRENQILVLVEGQGIKNDKAPLLQNEIKPDFTISFLYSGLFLEEEGIGKGDIFENEYSTVDWSDCMNFRFLKKRIHLTDRTLELMEAIRIVKENF